MSELMDQWLQIYDDEKENHATPEAANAPGLQFILDKTCVIMATCWLDFVTHTLGIVF